MHAFLQIAAATQRHPDGRVDVMGINLPAYRPGPITGALVATIELPSDYEPPAMEMPLRITLMDENGEMLVTGFGENGQDETLTFGQDLTAPQADWLAPGQTIRVTREVPIFDLLIQTEGRYEWRMTIGEETDPAWSAYFYVLSL